MALRILYLANNWLGLEVLRWLKMEREDIVALVIHSQEKQKYGGEIVAESGVEEERIFLGSDLKQDAILEVIRSIRPDIGISVLFDHILDDDFLSIFPNGCLNLHPAYLPYNRGQYPNVWSIVEDTPAGVTLHYIDAGIDTGDIIAQQAVAVEPIDTGETLYRKLEVASVDLFRNTWPKIKARRAPRIRQEGHAGTYHRKRDVESIDSIDLDQKYVARDLINLLRARTYPPFKGAYFEQNGKRVYLRVQLYYDEPPGSEKLEDKTQ